MKKKICKVLDNLGIFYSDVIRIKFANGLVYDNAVIVDTIFHGEYTIGIEPDGIYVIKNDGCKIAHHITKKSEYEMLFELGWICAKLNF